MATALAPRKSVGRKHIDRNDLMAVMHYVHVEDVGTNVLKVKGVDGIGQFDIIGKDLIAKAFSADQYRTEETVSMTQAAEILVGSYNRPLTVCFEKQSGEERVLRGRLIKPEPLLGRSTCEDLDIKKGNRLRLVDHRTIKYLIVNNVRYNVK